MAGYVDRLVGRARQTLPVVQPVVEPVWPVLPPAEVAPVVAEPVGDVRPPERRHREAALPRPTQAMTEPRDRTVPEAAPAPRREQTASTGERPSGDAPREVVVEVRESPPLPAVVAGGGADAGADVPDAAAAPDPAAVAPVRRTRPVTMPDRGREPSRPPPSPRPTEAMAPTAAPQPPAGPVPAPEVPTAAPAPTVRVTIGTIEVRAPAPAPPPRRSATASTRPPAGRALADYLARRDSGGRR